MSIALCGIYCSRLSSMAPCRKESRTCTVSTINTYRGRGEPKQGKVQLWSSTGVTNESELSAQCRLRTCFVFPFSSSRNSHRHQRGPIQQKSDYNYPAVPWLWEESESPSCIFREKAKGQVYAEEPRSLC